MFIQTLTNLCSSQPSSSTLKSTPHQHTQGAAQQSMDLEVGPRSVLGLKSSSITTSRVLITSLAMLPKVPLVFEALPTEVLGNILQQLASPEDLFSTIRASPNALGSFRCFREAILINVLQTHLPAEIFAEYLGLMNTPKYEDFNYVPERRYVLSRPLVMEKAFRSRISKLMRVIAHVVSLRICLSRMRAQETNSVLGNLADTTPGALSSRISSSNTSQTSRKPNRARFSNTAHRCPLINTKSTTSFQCMAH